MERQIFQVEYGGHPVRYAFQYPATRWRFRKFIHSVAGEEYDILSTHERIEAARAVLPEGSRDDYAEYRSLISLTAKELLRCHCCIFHAVSFLWQGYAWLLTAPSGTGKTTQYLNWQRLYPDEITMICGDMPVLERREDGSIWVHPTSWNGKENMGNRLSAPLGGIVLLEQGDVNAITPLSPRDAIMPFFRQFLVRPETEPQIHALSGIIDQMLRNLPTWKFVNLGDDTSTGMLRDTLIRRLKELSGGNDGTL